jgi:hypothetical protein
VTIHNPTLEDFLRRARQEFHFLVLEFGFREQASRRRADLNQFQVRYRNDTTLVRVEGINWGYGVQVLLGPRRRPLFGRDDNFPLWPIVKLREPDLYKKLFAGDQLAQLAAHAVALKRCAEEVLRGNFAIRAEVDRSIKEAPSQRSEMKEGRYRIAVEEANKAFRAKDYQRVVEVLAEHENRLTRAQRSKLEYAKRRNSKTTREGKLS